MAWSAWLEQHLKNIGAFNADGVSRKLRPRVCSGCSLRCLTALDSDVCGLPRLYHPEPLSRQGEAASLVLGLATYTVDVTGKPWQRGVAAIQRGDAKIVLAEHRCGLPRGPASWYSEPVVKITVVNDDPPF